MEHRPPRHRFNPGDRFEFIDLIWEIVLMYRLESEPRIWYHILAECEGDSSEITNPTDRILWEPIRSGRDAMRIVRCHHYCSNFDFGYISIRTTAELLKFKRSDYGRQTFATQEASTCQSQDGKAPQALRANPRIL